MRARCLSVKPDASRGLSEDLASDDLASDGLASERFGSAGLAVAGAAAAGSCPIPAGGRGGDSDGDAPWVAWAAARFGAGTGSGTFSASATTVEPTVKAAT